MGLFEEYEGLFTKYRVIYGEKTIVLYQNGGFFEVYGVDNQTEKIGLVKEISSLLNLQMGCHDGKINENTRSHWLFMGFPLSTLDRQVAILTEEYQYVVVIVEQTTPAPKPKREVTRIISPGTDITYLTQPHGNYVCSIYLESEGQKIQYVKPVNLLTIGLSVIDLSTGSSVVYETSNFLDDANRACDETCRFLQTFQPREILINTRDLNSTRQELLMQLGFGENNAPMIHCYMNQVPSEYHKLVFQNEFLGRLFKETGMLTPIEFLSLERFPVALMSYMLILNFCHQHMETILDKIEGPTIWNRQTHLVLENTCLTQLNLISIQGTSRQSSLFNLVDHTQTPMGKRLLKEKLLLPLIDPKIITERYDYLDFFRRSVTGDNDENLKCLKGQSQVYCFQQYEPFLKQIYDLERLHRKMCLGLLQPCEFNQLDTSYQAILHIMEFGSDRLRSLSKDPELRTHLEEYISYYRKILNLEETAKSTLVNLETSFFQLGYDPEIDALQQEITEGRTYFLMLAQQMSQLIAPQAEKPVVTWDFTNDHGYHLEVTSARFKTIISKNAPPIQFQIGTNKTYIVDLKSLEIQTNRSGSRCNLTSTEIKELSRKLITAHEDLQKAIIETYKIFLTQTYTQFSVLLKNLSIWIASVDFYQSNAKTSLLYGYCRPQLDLTKNESGLKANKLRHPLIEQLQERCQYVPQDLELSMTQKGILLFGVNCSGKSSLMRAVGMATIMAQAGLYVPAESFIYTPFHSILTRIIGNDNLFRGQSSFAVEMSELRGILKRANPMSLVLGDEICHGTETISAVSLVAATLITLSQRRTNFLFTTHLHALSEIDAIIRIETLKMYHLKVTYHEDTGDLIYDRQLVPGPGLPIYGLEVAKSMDLNREFIELANEIRKGLLKTEDLVPTKKSNYNTKVYLGRCAIPECPNLAELTHHIKFQSDSDSQGFIEHIQKNHKSNLLPLCRQCHDRLHTEQPGEIRYVINGYKMTSKGPQLDYEKVVVPPLLPQTTTSFDPVKCLSEQPTTSESVPKFKLVLRKNPIK